MQTADFGKQHDGTLGRRLDVFWAPEFEPWITWPPHVHQRFEPSRVRTFQSRGQPNLILLEMAGRWLTTANLFVSPECHQERAGWAVERFPSPGSREPRGIPSGLGGDDEGTCRSRTAASQ